MPRTKEQEEAFEQACAELEQAACDYHHHLVIAGSHVVDAALDFFVNPGDGIQVSRRWMSGGPEATSMLLELFRGLDPSIVAIAALPSIHAHPVRGNERKSTCLRSGRSRSL